MKASSKKGSGRKDPAKKGATAKVATAVQQNGVQPKRRVPAVLLASAHQWLKAADVAVRVALFLFSGLMLSTIRHWAIWDDLDSSWVFGLNYAAAHGLRM